MRAAALSALDHVILQWPTHLTNPDTTGSAPTSWIQLAKTGSWTSKRYGKFSITRTDLSTMLHNFTAITPKSPTQLPVDYDHKSMAPVNPGDGIAAGWMQKLELRDGGESLWAQVAWTPTAATRITNKEYQFVSPSFVKDYVHKDGQSIGTTLLAAAVTNHPFLEGMAALTLSGDLLDDVAIPAGLEVAAAVVSLADVGQMVTIKDDPDGPGIAYQVAEVVGVGDDSFIGLTDATGARVAGWYRITELAPAPAADPTANPAATTPEAAAKPNPFGASGAKPTAFGAKPAAGAKPTFGATAPGAADPAAGGNPDAHAAAASAHASAASAHAGAINKGFSMSQTFTLSVNGADVQVTAEQLEAAGISVVPEGSVAVPQGTVDVLTGQVTNLSAQVAAMAAVADASQKAAVALELSTTLDRLSKAGRLLKPTREWAAKFFGAATDLAAFREWAAAQSVVLSLNTEHGIGASGAADADAEKKPGEKLLELATARAAEKHISLSAAVTDISREHPGLAADYRTQSMEEDSAA